MAKRILSVLAVIAAIGAAAWLGHHDGQEHHRTEVR
jgi:hypothetical protein